MHLAEKSWLAVGGEPHHFVLPAVYPEAEVASGRAVEGDVPISVEIRGAGVAG